MSGAAAAPWQPWKPPSRAHRSWPCATRSVLTHVLCSRATRHVAGETSCMSWTCSRSFGATLSAWSSSRGSFPKLADASMICQRIRLDCKADGAATLNLGYGLSLADGRRGQRVAWTRLRQWRRGDEYGVPLLPSSPALRLMASPPCRVFTCHIAQSGAETSFEQTLNLKLQPCARRATLCAWSAANSWPWRCRRQRSRAACNLVMSHEVARPRLAPADKIKCHVR